MTSLVLRKVKSGGVVKLRYVPVVLRKVISDGVVKLERVQVICPTCRQQVEAVAADGRVKGYCAVAKQDVDFLIETQRILIGKHPIAETKAKISAGLTPMTEGRDSKGRFVKGNVPRNKRGQPH